MVPDAVVVTAGTSCAPVIGKPVELKSTGDDTTLSFSQDIKNAEMTMNKAAGLIIFILADLK